MTRLRSTRYWILSGAISLAALPACWADEEGRLVLHEDFESIAKGDLGEVLANDERLEVRDGVGANGGRGLLVTYEGYDRGSRRLTERFPLGVKGDEFSLNYDVRFEQDFQFVKGGKLHGLGPDRPITGGRPMRANGWSARVTFKEKGSIRSYLYCQNKDGQYGVSLRHPTFRFERGRYYAISLHAKLNSEPEKDDGFARIYVNGELLVDHRGVRFRGSMGDETLISQFMFSTFHGGHEPDWAPKSEDGSYKDVHACFDNISVYRGERIRMDPGG